MTDSKTSMATTLRGAGLVPIGKGIYLSKDTNEGLTTSDSSKYCPRFVEQAKSPLLITEREAENERRKERGLPPLPDPENLLGGSALDDGDEDGEGGKGTTKKKKKTTEKSSKKKRRKHY
ncbi:hypothetical protein FB446DRAFT_705472 [Lentinula raphanica]|nr:hypothetical protein FB446DRAFT_705472 [Lentinula raphanica]KAJ3825831.1 hypothetical protein F5880DRAFT_1505126 [Lentinula raphanica]